MSENCTYADLNFPAVAGWGSKLPKENDTQAGPVYAEVKLKPLDTSSLNTCAATGLMSQEVNTSTKEPGQHNPGRRHCSRVCGLVLGAVTILLVICVTLIVVNLPKGQVPSEQQTVSRTTTTGVPMTQGPRKLQTVSKTTKAFQTSQGTSEVKTVSKTSTGCPSGWTENRTSCYFLSEGKDKKSWNASMEECEKNGSKLVIINSKDELDFLYRISEDGYYFLGLTYSNIKWKWNWIDDKELDTDLFNITRNYTDYFCAVVGHNCVASADCNGSSTSKYMCEKAVE